MWLLRLYPRAWRERYGDEMAELLSHERLSPRLVIDLVAGALDARLNPQLGSSGARHEPAEPKEQEMKFAEVSQLHCAGHGPKVTAREQWLSVALTLGCTAALTAVWMWAAVTYRDPQVRQYVLAFSQIPLFTGLIAAMPVSMLKGRSGATKAIMTSVSLVVLVAWCALLGFVASTF